MPARYRDHPFLRTDPSLGPSSARLRIQEAREFIESCRKRLRESIRLLKELSDSLEDQRQVFGISLFRETPVLQEASLQERLLCAGDTAERKRLEQLLMNWLSGSCGWDPFLGSIFYARLHLNITHVGDESPGATPP